MRKSYITKKNIGKIKSKNTRLGKSKKISRKNKQNKIHKILKQSGGANTLANLNEEDFGKEIDYRDKICNTDALRDIWPILIFFRKRSRLKETMEEGFQEEDYFNLNIESNIFFEKLNPEIFEYNDLVYIGLILKLVDVTLRELRMKIKFFGNVLAHTGDVLPNNPGKRDHKYKEINNLSERLFSKKVSRNSPFLDDSEEPKSDITQVITYLKKNQLLYDKKRNNMILDFAYYQRQAQAQAQAQAR